MLQASRSGQAIKPLVSLRALSFLYRDSSSKEIIIKRRWFSLICFH